VTTPIRVLVCDDQVLIRTGLVTIIDGQPDLEVAGECGTAALRSTSPARCARTS